MGIGTGMGIGMGAGIGSSLGAQPPQKFVSVRPASSHTAGSAAQASPGAG